MAKYIVEWTKAFKVEAENEDEAIQKVAEATAIQSEAYHIATDCWNEYTAVYKAEDSEQHSEVDLLHGEADSDLV